MTFRCKTHDNVVLVVFARCVIRDLTVQMGKLLVPMQVDLDKKRNALFAGQLLITLITAGFSFIAMVAGIFGMNLNSGVETANGWFLGVTVLSAGLAVSVTVGLVAFLRYHRMLFLGD